MQWMHSLRSSDDCPKCTLPYQYQFLRIGRADMQKHWTNTGWSKIIPAFLPPTNPGLLMHSHSALLEHVSLNLAGMFFLDPVSI